MIPTPTPDQAVHVLKILGEWTKRGWRYESSPGVPVEDPRVMILYKHDHEWLHSYGVNHFDALCQATTVMQVLLEEFPEKGRVRLMAFVTSYERKTPGGVRIRVLCCYDGAKADSGDPALSHTVHYPPQGIDRYLPHVDELWREHGWGRRGKQTPVCPGHRIASDTDWPKEDS